MLRAGLSVMLHACRSTCERPKSSASLVHDRLAVYCWWGRLEQAKRCWRVRLQVGVQLQAWRLPSGFPVQTCPAKLFHVPMDRRPAPAQHACAVMPAVFKAWVQCSMSARRC